MINLQKKLLQATGRFGTTNLYQYQSQVKISAIASWPWMQCQKLEVRFMSGLDWRLKRLKKVTLHITTQLLLRREHLPREIICLVINRVFCYKMESLCCKALLPKGTFYPGSLLKWWHFLKETIPRLPNSYTASHWLAGHMGYKKGYKFSGQKGKEGRKRQKGLGSWSLPHFLV